MMVTETLLKIMQRDMKIILWQKKNLKRKIKTKNKAKPKKTVWHKMQMMRKKVMIVKKVEKRINQHKMMIKRKTLELKRVMLINMLIGGTMMIKRKQRKLRMILPMLLKILKFIKK